MLSWRLDAAEKRAHDAMQVDPDSARARTLLGRVLALHGELAEALEELERAVGLDPNDERARLSLGWELCYQGECDEALQQAHAAAYFEPSLHGPHLLAAAAHCNEGAWEDTLSEIEQARERAPFNPWAEALLAFALGRSGQDKRAQTLIESLAVRAGSGEISRVCLAAARLGLSQMDEAKADLDAAFEQRDPQLQRLRLRLFGDLSNRPLPVS
jgi:tetratricopeptide (TPR) repeat protein